MSGNNQITAIIKTIGRSTLQYAIESAYDQHFNIIVVGDGYEPLREKQSFLGEAEYFYLPRKWGHYGCMAANVGVAMASTDYITFLDDDDEFVEGAGDKMRAKIEESPDVDIWIPGLRFNDGMELCEDGEKGVNVGNVAVPTYKIEWFGKVPMGPVPELMKQYWGEESENYTDFYHVLNCQQLGAKIDWYEEILYLVRPRLEGLNGRGS